MDQTNVFEDVIDRLQDSPGDLLTTALVSRLWVPRSRYHIMKSIWANGAQLESFEELVRFTELLSSPLCTFLQISKAFKGLEIDTQPLLPGPLRADAAELLGRGLHSFLEHTVIGKSLIVKMGNMALHESQSSPFPWLSIAQWTDLSYITITATLPSLTMLATAVVALRRLDTAELDVEFLDAYVPSFSAREFPRSFKHLEFGSRGHSFFSWLAVSQAWGVHLSYLAISIGTEDLAPFMKFASSQVHYNIDWLEVTFQKDRVDELAPCLSFFEEVNEMTLALHFSPVTAATYKECIQSSVAALNMVNLASLRFTIPSRLRIPWPLGMPTPPDDLDGAQLGRVKIRNHVELALLDQAEVGPLTEFAIRCVAQRQKDLSGDSEEETVVSAFVTADRGAVCHH